MTQQPSSRCSSDEIEAPIPFVDGVKAPPRRRCGPWVPGACLLRGGRVAEHPRRQRKPPPSARMAAVCVVCPECSAIYTPDVEGVNADLVATLFRYEALLTPLRMPAPAAVGANVGIVERLDHRAFPPAGRALAALSAADLRSALIGGVVATCGVSWHTYLSHERAVL